MAQARLVKRKELMAREQAGQPQTPPPPKVSQTVESVVNWVQRHKAARRPNPREAFAALFAQPQAS